MSSSSLLIRNATLVNEGALTEADVLIRHGRIDRIGHALDATADHTLDARGLHLLPGLIDDQVHFREPGLTAKGEIATESAAAVAGGITSYMEMPNTLPPTMTRELVQQKYDRAAQVSVGNYGFYIGGGKDNLDEILACDPNALPGIKVFMGSSTGNLLLDDPEALERLFAQAPMLIATHCEHEPTVRANTEAFLARYGDDVPPECHPIIRNAEACYRSSAFAVDLAKRHNTRLHILHISTAKELELFDANTPLDQKRITAEACVHHLWFSDADYANHGHRIKWNPAVKTAADRAALRQALKEGRIDVLATDHAPHTLAEKTNPYAKCPSGGPLVQHALLAWLDLVKQGVYTLPEIVQWACHNVAVAYQVAERGYIRPGYWADLVLVDLNTPTPVTRESLLYKCGWSPFEGHTFTAQVHTTLVNGQVAYANGQVDRGVRGAPLRFNRV